MKFLVCLVAVCVIGYVSAETCTLTSTCDTTLTQCGAGFDLECKDTGSGMHCVCVNDAGVHHACNAAHDECHNQNHVCATGYTWECVAGHCHCGV